MQLNMLANDYKYSYRCQDTGKEDIYEEYS